MPRLNHFSSFIRAIFNTDLPFIRVNTLKRYHTVNEQLPFHYQLVTPNFYSGFTFKFIRITTTTVMNSVTKKLQILESLNAMDQSQTEKVLAYIKDILTPKNEVEYKRNKREAMKEIRQALNHERRLKLSL